ncbi:MAG: rhomboid family intramembrane serine protease [Hyphomonadaceae bacterium]
MRLPNSVLLLGGLIVLAFVALGQYAPEAHPGVFNTFAVVPAQFTEGTQSPGQAFAPLFGHVFFHYGILHLVMNTMVFLQAAPFVARRIGDARFIVLFFLAALGGAIAFILINPHSQVGMVGASGAICGVYGAYFLSVRPTPRAALADPQVRNAMLSFLGINVVLMAFLPLPIAWEAHLGGFVAGAAAYPLLAPRRRAAGPWG